MNNRNFIVHISLLSSVEGNGRIGAFGLSRPNTERYKLHCVDDMQQPTGGPIDQVGWLGLRVSSHLALSYIHQVNSRNDYSTISIVLSRPHYIIRSTLRSRPNNIYMGLKCPSVRTYVRTFVRPQKVFLIPMKFGRGR